MNNFIATIISRRSIRKYEPRPIPDAVKETIIQATLRAPTAGNLMLYSIIEIEDHALKERLSHTCDEQPFIAQAPWILLFCADYQRLMDWFDNSAIDRLCKRRSVHQATPEEGDLLLACCDALIAAQTAVLAAESFGVGSCYIGDILENYEVHRKLLDLPKYVLPITMVCFGYPTQQQKERPFTSRLDRDKVVFRDRYRRLAPEELSGLYQEDPSHVQKSRESDVENAGQEIYLRKFSALYTLELRRSVREMLKNWK